MDIYLTILLYNVKFTSLHYYSNLKSEPHPIFSTACFRHSCSDERWM